MLLVWFFVVFFVYIQSSRDSISFCSDAKHIDELAGSQEREQAGRAIIGCDQEKKVSWIGSHFINTKKFKSYLKQTKNNKSSVGAATSSNQADADSSTPAKLPRQESEENLSETEGAKRAKTEDSDEADEVAEAVGSVIVTQIVAGVLPGIGDYGSDSSEDSDDDSDVGSDEEADTSDIIGQARSNAKSGAVKLARSM